LNAWGVRFGYTAAPKTTRASEGVAGDGVYRTALVLALTL
jgi:hypothetical protein